MQCLCKPRQEDSHVRQYVSRKGLNILNINNTNLDTRSSTESDLAEVNDVIPMVLWRNYFLFSQVYSTNIDIFQYN